MATVPKRIVVGVDGSDDSNRALEWAAEEAQLRHADLEVVYVRFARMELLDDYPDLTEEESEVLSAAVKRAARLAPGVRVCGRLLGPPAGEALVEVSEGAGMLVIGTRGLSFWGRVEQGSVSMYCLRHSCCPVVMVRPVESKGEAEETPRQSGVRSPRPA